MPFLQSSTTWRGQLLLALALLALPIAKALAAAPSCEALCQSWQLDVTASDNPTAVIDQAMQSYKPPRDRRRMPSGDSVEAMTRAADEAALGPIHKRPQGDLLRTELLQTLTQPQTITLAPKGRDISITRDGKSPQIISIDEPYARVDDFGTAKIRNQWQQGQLVTTESYDRRRQLRRSYRFDKKLGALVFTQFMTRPGLAPVTVTSVYRKRP